MSNRTGAGMNPCGAMQTKITVKQGDTAELLILLGADGVLNDVNKFWTEILGQVQVKTPDRPFDIMVNGWLLYQTIACRMWARSGFYQASGAFG